MSYQPDELVNIRVRRDEAEAIIAAGRCLTCQHLMALHNYDYDYGTEDCWTEDCNCGEEPRFVVDEIAVRQMGL
jgi:hypothetical protein